MMIGKTLLVIMISMRLMGASGDSGEGTPCPNQAVLQCPNITIEGKVGDTVILPCLTKNKTDISHEQVEWLFENVTTGKHVQIHDYVRGTESEIKSVDFINRTYLGNLSSGNSSLHLVVAEFDSGTYHCRVPGHVCCPVTLKVLPAGGDDSSQKHQEVTVSPDKPNNGTDGQTQNNWTTGPIVGVAVVGVVGFALIGLGIYCCREHRNPRKSGTKSNSPQNNLELAVLSQQPPQNEENEPEDQNPNDEQSQMLENENQDEPADGN